MKNNQQYHTQKRGDKINTVFDLLNSLNDKLDSNNK